MLRLQNGVVLDPRIRVELVPQIAHGTLGTIHAIIVNQTDSHTAAGTIAGYKQDAKETGTHFLIDRDGTIYQTVSLMQKCWHIGPLKQRCVAEHVCAPAVGPVRAVGRREMKKQYPIRYPSNEDSIGIELVGMATGKDTYEHVSAEQQRSLDWLIPQLLDTMHLTRGDIYRHPQVSYKSPGEALSARY